MRRKGRARVERRRARQHRRCLLHHRGLLTLLRQALRGPKARARARRRGRSSCGGSPRFSARQQPIGQGVNYWKLLSPLAWSRGMTWSTAVTPAVPKHGRRQGPATHRTKREAAGLGTLAAIASRLRWWWGVGGRAPLRNRKRRGGHMGDHGQYETRRNAEAAHRSRD